MEGYLQRAIELANRANTLQVSNNPKVGAVLVHEDKIIGEGYHHKKGQEHAEVMAINSVRKENIKTISKSTLYVSLEPCSHTGLTPPCSDLILKKGIKKVVIAIKDPSEKVVGIELLKKNNVEVHLATPSLNAQRLIRAFNANNVTKRPFISLKWASSKDGYMGKKEEQVWLSNPTSTIYTHKLRANHDAILIGKNTALLDRPRLNIREYKGDSPTIILIGYDNSIDINRWLDNNRKVIIFSKTEIGVSHINLKSFVINQELEIKNTLSQLHQLGINRILVEGGAFTLNQFIKSNLWDEAHVIQTQRQLYRGIKSPNIIGIKLDSYRIIDNEVSLIGNNRHYKS